MMPVLQAEEAMQWATILAVGTGSLKKGEATRITREWRRRTHRPGSRPQRTPPTREQLQFSLARIGVEMELIPIKKPEEPEE